MLDRVNRLTTNFLARRRVTSARAKSPGKAPLISVVVPAHNEERYLRQCLDSVAMQNHEAFECIVVDDASSDRTAELVEGYAQEDTRFRLVSHRLNRGLSAARNSGADVAKGSLLTFLDGDDYLYQNALFDRVAALEGNDDIRVGGSFMGIQSVPEKGLWWESLAPYLVHRQETVTFLSRAGECPFPAHAPLIRTEIFRQFGGFDETMDGGCEDWDLWQRILRDGYRFLSTNSIGGAYRMRPGSMRLEKAARHSLTAAALLARAYSPASMDQSKPFFHEPLGYYIGELGRVRRLIRGATLARANGDEVGVARCLAELPANSEWPLWVVDVSAEVRANLYLHAAGDAAKASEFKAKAKVIEREIVAALAANGAVDQCKSAGTKPSPRSAAEVQSYPTFSSK